MIDIVSMKSTFVVYVQLYSGEYFVVHFSAFLVKPAGTFSVLNVCTFEDHRPVIIKSCFEFGNWELYTVMPYCY